MIEQMWTAFNAEDSWLPFMIPFCTLWLPAFLYCNFAAPNVSTEDRPTASSPSLQPSATAPPPTTISSATTTDTATPSSSSSSSSSKEKASKEKLSYHNLTALHNFFNISGVVASLFALYVNDDDVLRERVLCMYTWSYFSVDLVDCLIRGDVPFTFHAIFSIIITYWHFTIPICGLVRNQARSLLLETSSPFLLLAKRTRNPLHFAIFAAVFFVVRVLGVPLIVLDLVRNGLPKTHYYILGATCFYALNLYWFYRVSIAEHARDQSHNLWTRQYATTYVTTFRFVSRPVLILCSTRINHGCTLPFSPSLCRS